MIIKDNMANMCAKVTSIYMEFTLAFGPKPEFSFSFKYIKGMSIGVKNVSDRIKHLYGNEYGLEIDAYEGMGTIVKYWLPLIWEDV